MSSYLVPYSKEDIQAEVLDAVLGRGVTRLMHFTTNRGLVGILATNACKSRPLLRDEEYLEYILTNNCSVRRESLKLQSYVNLSVEHINGSFFGICEDNWHRNKDFWWCVLEFAPEIAAHDGVLFANTNNFYSGVSRKPGVEGFEDMYAEKVWQYAGTSISRSTSNGSYPTCAQAEVLYPLQIPITYLRRVFVRTDEHAASVEAMAKALGYKDLPIVVDRTVFQVRS